MLLQLAQQRFDRWDSVGVKLVCPARLDWDTHLASLGMHTERGLHTQQNIVRIISLHDKFERI